MIKSFWVVILLLLIAACDLVSTQSEADKSVDLIPLDVGNSWIIRSTVTDVDTGSETQPSSLDTLRVIGDTLISEERWFWVGGGDGTYLATNRDDGYWTAGSADFDESDPTLVYKYPVSVGEEFVRPSWPDSATFRVVSLDTTVTVPAGTFESAHYAQIWTVAGKQQQCDFFVAPGVGLVKKVLPWIEGSTGDVMWLEVDELIEYHLN